MGDGARLTVTIDLPAWAESLESVGTPFGDEEERLRLAVELSRLNVERATGGPFGAAVFDAVEGRLVSVGVNSVVRLNNSVLHAEVVACMRAQTRLGSFTLAASETGSGGHVLYSSCEPCAMCLGAILWSGVTRVVYAARRDDAEAVHFDEGPVFPETYAYLRRRGIRIGAGGLREEAREVLQRYQALGGSVYNG